MGFVIDTAAGMGNLKKLDHRGHMRDLRRAARGRPDRTAEAALTRREPMAAPSAPAAPDPAYAAPDAIAMGAMGVGIVYQNAAGEEFASLEEAAAAAAEEEE